MSHWFVVKTKRRMESQVANDMTREHITASVPMQLVIYRTKEDRAKGTRSRKETPVLAGLVFVRCEFARPVAHIDGVSGYMRMSDHEYATVSDSSFRGFCEQIEAINDETRRADALQYELASRKMKKVALEFKEGLEVLKSRMETNVEQAA